MMDAASVLKESASGGRGANVPATSMIAAKAGSTPAMCASGSASFSFTQLPQVAVRVAEETPHLLRCLDRWCQKLGAARPQRLVGCSAIGHSDGHLVAHRLRVGR